MDAYGFVSFVVFVMGLAAWVSAWQETSRFLPNRRFIERQPRVLAYMLWVRRTGRVLIIGGAINLVVYFVLDQIVHS